MENQTDEITFKEVILTGQKYLQYLLPKWKIIVGCGIIGTLLGLTIALIYAPKYKATVTVLVDDTNSAGGLMGFASNLGFGGTIGEQSPFSIANIIQLFKSKTIIESALLQPIGENEYNKITFADLYIKEYELNKGWENEPVLKNIQFKVNEDRSRFGREKDSILGEIYTQIIEERLSVSQPDKKTSFIQAEVITPNETFSKNFAEELTIAIAKYYANFKTQKAQSSVDALQYQVDSVKQSLYISMGGAASSLDQVFGLNPAMSIQKISSTKEQAQAQMNIAILQELVKNLEVAKMDLLNNTPVIHIVDKPAYPLEKKEIGKSIGLVGGGFFGGVLAIAFLLGKQFIRDNF